MGRKKLKKYLIATMNDTQKNIEIHSMEAYNRDGPPALGEVMVTNGFSVKGAEG